MTPFTMKYVCFLAGPSDAFPGGAEDWRPLLRIKLRSSDGRRSDFRRGSIRDATYACFP
jgi:hypothetical protein